MSKTELSKLRDLNTELLLVLLEILTIRLDLKEARR